MEEARTEAAQAQQLFDAGDLKGAQAAIGRALSHRDDDPNILLLDARIKLAMQDLAGARETYRTVLVFDPDNLEALTTVVQISSMFDDKATVREMIPRALALDPDNAEVLLAKGVMEIREKKYEAAIATADRMLDPADPRGAVLKARAQFLAGDRAASYQLLRDKAQTYGNNQLIAAALLENARAEGDVPAMLEQFVFLSSVDNNSADLALDEINIRYKSGDVTSARQQGLDYLNRFGSNAEQVGRLVALWDEYDPTPLAPGDLGALAQGPNLEAKLAVVRFLINGGAAESPAPLLANSSDPRVFGIMARLQVMSGNRKGFDAAQRILAADATNCEALTAAAQWHFNQRSYQQAIIPAQVLATQCRDRIDGYLILAAAYQRLGRPAAVERAYREGIAAHAQNSLLAGLFADWLISAKRESSAVAVARRLTVMAPSRVSSWRLRERICRQAADVACQQEAARGLAAAKVSYTLDPLPGVKRGDTLFGRTWK